MREEDKMVSEVLGEESVLTPSDLYNKEFRKALFGYRPHEVDAFLERVADVLESFIVRVHELKERLEELKTKADEYHQMETTLRSSLVSSQKFGENLIEAAKREAKTLLEAARVEQDRIKITTAKFPAALTREIEELQAQRNRLRAEMLGILSAHRTFLDSLTPAEEMGADEVSAAASKDDTDGSTASHGGTHTPAAKTEQAETPVTSGPTAAAETVRVWERVLQMPEGFPFDEVEPFHEESKPDAHEGVVQGFGTNEKKPAKSDTDPEEAPRDLDVGQGVVQGFGTDEETGR